MKLNNIETDESIKMINKSNECKEMKNQYQLSISNNIELSDDLMLIWSKWLDEKNKLINAFRFNYKDWFIKNYH